MDWSFPPPDRKADQTFHTPGIDIDADILAVRSSGHQYVELCHLAGGVVPIEADLGFHYVVLGSRGTQASSFSH